MTPIRKTLDEIFENQEFDRLEPFKPVTVWKDFSQDEKDLLAKLLVMQGAHQLSRGEDRVMENFDIANKVSSHSSEILFQQAKVLSSYHENIRCLNLASQILDRVIQQDPLLFKGWILRAQVSSDMGIYEDESSHFDDAHCYFEEAESLLNETNPCIRQEAFYWKWGRCLASLGEISGEPVDFFKSIEKYRKALEYGCQDVKFYNDFGTSLAYLSGLLEISDYSAEALIYFNHAVKNDPFGYEGWYNQACCLLYLTSFQSDPKIFEQSHFSFESAAEISPNCSQLWMKWGMLEFAFAKEEKDLKKLESCVAKFAKAHQLEPDHPQILSSWAESELFLGVQEERVDLIQSAYLKVQSSLEIDPEDAHSWYVYGSSLIELGRYFADKNYFEQAIEKLQYGLSISSKYSLLWYGMAQAHFDLADLKGQQGLYEKAVKYFEHYFKLEPEGFHQFWNDWGVALMKLGELTHQASYIEIAIDKFERALKHCSQNEEVQELNLECYFNYGCAFDLLGDFKDEPRYFEKAVHILNQVVQCDSNYHLARYHLAISLGHLGDAVYELEPYHKAIEHFEYLMHADPENDIVYLDYGMALTCLGLLVHDIHHPEKYLSFLHQAEVQFKQAAALGNTQAFYQIAGLFSILGDYDQAMHYLERAKFCGILPGIEDLLHDEWLEKLRNTLPFRKFINEISNHHKGHE